MMCERLFWPSPNTQLLLVGLSIVGALVGCNKSPAMVQVRGKVAYHDGSVPHGGVRIVRFEPVQDTAAEKRRTASGNIGDDGSFELFTRMPGDGVIPGTYNVTFTVWKGEHDRVSLIADKYTASATTPFKNVPVEHDVTDLKFEIEPMPASGPAQ
jgi:hypothetical protein